MAESIFGFARSPLARASLRADLPSMFGALGRLFRWFGGLEVARTDRDASRRRALAVREVLSRLGDKWSLVLIMTLDSETLRFGELKRSASGISQRMLTLTLRSLERDGIVARIVRPSYPPRVDYSLTELGRTLLAVIQVLATWAEDHREDVVRARQHFDEEVNVDALPD